MSELSWQRERHASDTIYPSERAMLGGVERHLECQWRRSVAVLALFCVSVTPVACGSTTDPSTSTAAQGGQPADNCAEGDTRECVGKGACRGGQYCENDGWGSCECEGIGTAGAKMSAAGNGGATGGDATSLGGHPEQTGGAAAGGGQSTWDDDPCDGVESGCGSTLCPLSNETACSAIDQCSFWNIPKIEVDENRSYAVFRVPRVSELPEPSELPGDCLCADSPLAARFEVYVTAPGANGQLPDGHFTVRQPWYFGPCDSPVQCTESYPYVRTKSPDAPEVNVYYAPGPCPP